MRLRFLSKLLLPRRYHPYWRLRRIVEEAAKGGVVSGPFKGLCFPSEAAFGVYFAKVLGTYEAELHPVIQEVINLNFPRIIDIGAAEGYYACGLGRAMQFSKVIAFEATVRGRYFLHETVERNQLEDRVAVRGLCEVPQLAECLENSSEAVFILCDVEGYEYELLDPLRVPGLVQAAILVETHDFLMKGLSGKLKRRFESTHIIREIRPRPRRREDFPLAAPGRNWFPDRYFNSFTDDGRPDNNFWLWMTPRSEV